MQRGILILKHSPLQLLFVFSNPNLPVTLPSGSVWPQFEENYDMFMELNSASSTVISTPRKEKLHSIITDLFSARTLQLRADSPPQSKKLGFLSVKFEREGDTTPNTFTCIILLKNMLYVQQQDESLNQC